MARTEEAKSSPDLIRRAECMRSQGATMKQIGAALGVSTATASYWSRGVTQSPEYTQAFRAEAAKRRRLRLGQVSSYLTDEELARRLRALAEDQGQQCMSASQRRRLVRLLNEIAGQVARESRADAQVARRIER